MQIVFDSLFQKYTSLSEFTSNSSSIRGALGEVFNTFPQLYVAVASGELHDQTVLIVDDEEFLNSTNIKDTAETLEFLAMPSGKWEVGMGVAESLAVTLSSATSIAPAVAMVIADVIINTLTSIILSVVLQCVLGALSDDLAIPDLTTSSLNNSATYTWSGIKNTSATGTAVPIVYGKHRLGGMILNIFTRSADSNTAANIDASVVVNATDLYFHMGLCEGPVAAITDVEINKLPYTFYNAVEFAGMERLGEETQSAIPVFDEIIETVAYSRKVLNVSSPLGSPVQPVWENYTQVFGYVETADDAPRETFGTINLWNLFSYNPYTLVLGPYTLNYVE